MFRFIRDWLSRRQSKRLQQAGCFGELDSQVLRDRARQLEAELTAEEVSRACAKMEASGWVRGSAVPAYCWVMAYTEIMADRKIVVSKIISPSESLELAQESGIWETTASLQDAITLGAEKRYGRIARTDSDANHIYLHFYFDTPSEAAFFKLKHG